MATGGCRGHIGPREVAGGLRTKGRRRWQGPPWGPPILAPQPLASTPQKPDTSMAECAYVASHSFRAPRLLTRREPRRRWRTSMATSRSSAPRCPTTRAASSRCPARRPGTSRRSRTASTTLSPASKSGRTRTRTLTEHGKYREGKQVNNLSL